MKKRTSKGIALFCLALCACLFFYSFIRMGRQIKNTNSLKKISFVRSAPFFNKDGLWHITDSSCIYYADTGYAIYQIPIHNFVEHAFLDSVTSFDTYNYYCVKTGQKKSLLYRKYFSVDPEIVDVDSLIKKGDLVFNFDVYPIYSAGTIFSDLKVTPGKRIIQCSGYRQSGKGNYDTTFFYFNKQLSDIELSFSKRLDSLYQSKVVEIKFISNQFFSKELNKMVPKLETRIAMNYEEVSNRDSILYLLNKSSNYFK